MLFVVNQTPVLRTCGNYFSFHQRQPNNKKHLRWCVKAWHGKVYNTAVVKKPSVSKLQLTGKSASEVDVRGGSGTSESEAKIKVIYVTVTSVRKFQPKVWNFFFSQ